MNFGVHLKQSLFLIVLIIIISIPKVMLLGVDQLSVETKLIWEQEAIYIEPFDFNNDSIDELITIRDEITFQPTDQKLYSMIATRHFDKAIYKLNRCGGYSKDGGMWLTYMRNDSLFVYDAWPRREIYITHGKDIGGFKGWESRVTALEITDLDNDSDLEAVCLVGTSWDLKPRGIFVLDWNTKKLVWRYLFGPYPTELLIQDIDNDDKKEILVGTFANANGNVENNTSDRYSYVFMFNYDGSLRWQKQIGRYSSFTRLSWLQNNSTHQKMVLVMERGSSAGNRVHDSIFVLDALNGKVITKAQYGVFNAAHAVFYDKNNQARILVGGSDDTLRCLNENLKILQKHFVNGDGIWHIVMLKMNNKEDVIAVYTNKGYLKLYNQKFKLLSEYPSRMIDKIKPVSCKGHNRLLINLTRDEGRVWQLLEFQPLNILTRRVPLALVLVSFFVIIIMTSVGMLYARYSKIRDLRAVMRGLVDKAGIIVVNSHCEVTFINQHARNILGITEKNKRLKHIMLEKIKEFEELNEIHKRLCVDKEKCDYLETILRIKPNQTYLVRCVKIRNGVVLTFEDIGAVEYLKRLNAWIPIAQKLAHGIKNPLSTILSAAEQIENKTNQEELKKYTQYVKNEVTRLRKITDNFMRFTKLPTPSTEPHNINETILQVVARYKNVLPPNKKIELALTNNLPLLHYDQDSIANVLTIIIENSIDAIKKDGLIRITTSLSELDCFIDNNDNNKVMRKQYVKIVIQDNGIGIPTKYKNRIFDPYFSYDKPYGTGLGLPLAKKIIEDHQGIIEIESEENKGTTVNIYLMV